MTLASDLHFFDANVTIGRLAVPTLGSWLSPAALLDEMDRLQVAEALVSHAWAREIAQAAGNDALRAAIGAGQPRLHGLWMVNPHHGRVDPPEDAAVEALLAAGCRAAIVHPNPTLPIMDEAIHARHFVLHPATTGALFTALSSRRIPTFVDLAQVRWDEVYDTCAAYPDLPLVLLNVHYTHKRSLFAGLEAYPNLHFEISGWHVHEGIEELVREFGPGQVLYGSRLPAYAAAPAMAMVLYAGVPFEAKAAIAGGNLRRLLSGVRINGTT